MTQHHTTPERDLTTNTDFTTTPPTIQLNITTTNNYYAHALLHWLQADPTTITNTTGIEPHT